MFLTKKVVLYLLWFSASALILSAAPSLPAETHGASDAGATSASDSPSTVVMDPSVGDVGQQPKPDPGLGQTAGSGQAGGRPVDAEPATGAGESGTYLLTRTIGGLGLVISLIVLGYVAVRRYGSKYLRSQGSHSALKVIETLPIGEKRSIALIQVEDKRLLIGNTQQQITLLAQLPVGLETTIEPGREPFPKSNPGIVTSFRKLYEVEKNQPSMHQPKAIPQDLREKMRQLREAFER